MENDTEVRGPYFVSRRKKYHRAVNARSEHSGVACGAGTRDMKRASIMLGGTVCVKCFPVWVLSA